MGNIGSINKVNYAYVQKYIYNAGDTLLLINTLTNDKQECLIKNTISAANEEEIINKYLKTNKSIKILIYGENCSDNRVIIKYNQLYKLGFINLYVYLGGMFEWLLLQDIYGDDEFPTTSKMLDLLKYGGNNKMKVI
jgi:hypothetical protein